MHRLQSRDGLFFPPLRALLDAVIFDRTFDVVQLGNAGQCLGRKRPAKTP
jgi:hypothetical protein